MGVLAEGLKKRDEPVKCKFGALIAKYADDEDRAMIANRQVASAAITEEVSKAWGAVSAHNVRKHRDKQCTCYRGGE